MPTASGEATEDPPNPQGTLEKPAPTMSKANTTLLGLKRLPPGSVSRPSDDPILTLFSVPQPAHSPAASVPVILSTFSCAVTAGRLPLFWGLGSVTAPARCRLAKSAARLRLVSPRALRRSVLLVDVDVVPLELATSPEPSLMIVPPPSLSSLTEMRDASAVR